MAESMGMLGVWMEMPAEHEDELNRWYEEEHLPERMEIPGFVNVRRYAGDASPKYAAFYDLESLQVLHDPPYMKVRQNPTDWTRKIGRLLEVNDRNEYELVQSAGGTPGEAAPYIMTVRGETDPEHEKELNDWYEQEHLEALAGVPGVLRARRYVCREGAPGAPKYIAVYEFATPDVRESEAWKKAGQTPWTARIQSLFKNRQGYSGKLIRAIP